MDKIETKDWINEMVKTKKANLKYSINNSLEGIIKEIEFYNYEVLVHIDDISDDFIFDVSDWLDGLRSKIAKLKLETQY